ncbi:hypothetical protein [Marilutibacter penaei]|uniref:hypothetical protein n=1 Tax=Marilutibacter penaei TaxID=2759900 RepID=UPI003CCE05BF
MRKNVLLATALFGLLAGAAQAQDAAAPTATAAEPAPAAAQATTIDPNSYTPRTEHDNAPYRFNMHQEGRQMTADEFDAWMKARGVRVARGSGAAAAPAVATAGAVEAEAPVQEAVDGE